VNVAYSEVEEEIRRWLECLAEFFDADRCSFGEFSEDGKRLMISYSCSPEGISPAPDYIPEGQLPNLIGQLRLGLPVVMNEHHDLLPEWESERR
jgi:hypothetical protein